MGAPELPGDPVEDLPTHHVHQHPMPSDESDNENAVEYGGYERLAMNEPDDNDDTTAAEIAEAVAQHAEQATHCDPNLPPVETADAEIERQIWSEPRPQELQIELDTTRTAQILNAMASFTLPNVTVPEWAAGVPEERWKEELLQRIRQRKEQQPTPTAATSSREQEN